MYLCVTQVTHAHTFILIRCHLWQTVCSVFFFICSFHSCNGTHIRFFSRLSSCAVVVAVTTTARNISRIHSEQHTFHNLISNYDVQWTCCNTFSITTHRHPTWKEINYKSHSNHFWPDHVALERWWEFRAPQRPQTVRQTGRHTYFLAFNLYGDLDVASWHLLHTNE